MAFQSAAVSPPKLPHVIEQYTPSEAELQSLQFFSENSTSEIAHLFKRQTTAKYATKYKWNVYQLIAFQRKMKRLYNSTLPPPSLFDSKYGPLPIEPLVGLLRHPFDRDVENRDYLVLLSNRTNPTLFADVFPGRAIFIDCGCSAAFNISMRWFFEQYASKGIHFQEAHGWEIDPGASAFMSTDPSHLKEDVHFYHRPITAEPNHVDNPVHLIKRIYRPGDFVVLKLDVDHGLLETALVRQLLEHAADLVAEFFYECHHNNMLMWMYFKNSHGGTSLQDAYQLYVRARRQKLRWHPWP